MTAVVDVDVHGRRVPSVVTGVVVPGWLRSAVQPLLLERPRITLCTAPRMPLEVGGRAIGVHQRGGEHLGVVRRGRQRADGFDHEVRRVARRPLPVREVRRVATGDRYRRNSVVDNTCVRRRTGYSTVFRTIPSRQHLSIVTRSRGPAAPWGQGNVRNRSGATLPGSIKIAPNPSPALCANPKLGEST